MDESNEWDIVEHKLQQAVIRIWASLVTTVKVKFCTNEGKELESPIILDPNEMKLYFQEAEINRMDPGAGFAARQAAMMTWNSAPLEALQLWHREIVNQLYMKAVSIDNLEERMPYQELFEKLQVLKDKMERCPQIVLLCNEAKDGPCFRIYDENTDIKQCIICFADDYERHAFWWPQMESRHTQQGRFQCIGQDVAFSFDS